MWIAGRYLQRSHALSGVETEMGATLPTDNIDLQRSHALSGVETSVIISASSMNSNRLQRSHALSGVETVSELQCRYRPCGPSTKPRPFRRGDILSPTPGAPSLVPSTKPRPFRRGDRRSLRSAGYWGLFREPPARDPQDLESRAGHAFRAEVLFGGESGFSAPFERLRDEVSPPHRSQASTT